MKPTVFIQANDRQLLGAKISAHSYKRSSARPDSFDVKIMRVQDFPRLMQHGQSILRAGTRPSTGSPTTSRALRRSASRRPA